jgi:YidC/Oxa1 family membrane protein insertase
MGHIFQIILVTPLINLLVLLYNIIPDVGVVIILLTLVVRLILAPSFHKSLKSQKSMTALQPKMNEVREKHKNDKEAQAKAMMALYAEHKVSPFSSCLPLIVQLPILIALYKVFIVGLNGSDLSKYLYHFVHNPGAINPSFLGLANLAHPNVVFGVIAGLAQFVQSKMMLPKDSKGIDQTTRAISMQTVYVLPILTILFSLRLPAGLPLYWIVTTLFAIGQQYYIMKHNNPVEA